MSFLSASRSLGQPTEAKSGVKNHSEGEEDAHSSKLGIAVGNQGWCDSRASGGAITEACGN